MVLAAVRATLLCVAHDLDTGRMTPGRDAEHAAFARLREIALALEREEDEAAAAGAGDGAAQAAAAKRGEGGGSSERRARRNNRSEQGASEGEQ